MAPPRGRVAHEARAKPLERYAAASAALRHGQRGPRFGDGWRRDARQWDGFVGAWRQWSSIVLEPATLMRHILGSRSVDSLGMGCPALAPVPGAFGVGGAPSWRVLV